MHVMLTVPLKRTQTQFIRSGVYGCRISSVRLHLPRCNDCRSRDWCTPRERETERSSPVRIPRYSESHHTDIVERVLLPQLVVVKEINLLGVCFVFGVPQRGSSGFAGGRVPIQAWEDRKWIGHDLAGCVWGGSRDCLLTNLMPR